MESVQNPHDKFFKEMFSRRESAIDFLQHYLPAEISSMLDLPTLEPLKDSFVDEKLRNHYSDLLYRVELQQSGSLFIYILFEHKSYLEKNVSFQLLRYMVRIWEGMLRKEKSLSPIFPLVFYHGQARWNISRQFQGLFNVPEALKRYVPDYEYWFYDLSQYSDSEIKGNILLQVELLILKYIFRKELAEKLPEIFTLLQSLAQQKTGLEYLETLFIYLMSSNAPLSEQELQTAVDTARLEGGDQIMSTLAEKWIEKGRNEGRNEGRTEGRTEGRKEGIEEGLHQGLLEAIELGLDIKFGTPGLKELIRIRRIEEIVLLRAIRAAIKNVSSLEELRQLYEDYLPEPRKPSDPIN